MNGSLPLVRPLASSGVLILGLCGAMGWAAGGEQAPLLEVTEVIDLFSDGGLNVDLEMDMADPSPFSRLYRSFLGFSGDILRFAPRDVPEEVTTEDTFSISPADPNATYTAIEVSPTIVRVRDLLLEGVAREHQLSYGMALHIPPTPHNVRAVMWGMGGACHVSVGLSGSWSGQAGNQGRIAVGPAGIDAAFERADFLLTKVRFIQMMLESTDFQEIDRFQSVWTTHFVLRDRRVINQHRLLGKRWVQHFSKHGAGGDPNKRTFIQAELSILGYNEVVLTETLTVYRNDAIDVTADDLARSGMLCYKTFNLDFYLPFTPLRGMGARKEPGKGGASSLSLFPIEWEVPIIHETLDWEWKWDAPADDPVAEVGAGLAIENNVSLRGHIERKSKWFRVREFKSWLELSGSVEASCSAWGTIGWERTWDDWVLFERSKTTWVTIAYVPVLVTIKFSVEPALEVVFDGADAEYSYTREIHGQVRGGVKWKRSKGWSKYLNYGWGTSKSSGFQFNNEWEFTATPSIDFKVTVLFYETAGPFVGFQPYVMMRWKDPSRCGWYIDVHGKLHAGIAFGDWLESILDFKGWDWPIADYGFYSVNGCGDDQATWLATLTAIDAPGEAFVTEPVDVNLEVMNEGNRASTDSDPVSVDLSKVGGGVIASDSISDLRPGASSRVNFAWDTHGEPAVDHDTTLQGEVDLKGNSDTKEHLIHFNVKDAEVTAVLVSAPFLPGSNQIAEGQDVDISVRVRNGGGTVIPSMAVYAYYVEADSGLEHPISDVWCEAMTLLSDVQPGSTKDVKFRWSTWGVNSPPEYRIRARVDPLEYEIDLSNNVLDSAQSVYVIANPFTQPPTPQNFWPPQGATTFTGDTTLEWSLDDWEGEDLLVDIYVSRENPPTIFAAGLPVDRCGEHSCFHVPPTELRRGSVYYWRVASRRVSGDIAEGDVWSFMTEPAPCGRVNPGDELDISDAIFLLSYLFTGGPGPDPECAADANGDRQTDISDAVYILLFLFAGGSPPVDDCCP